MRSVHHSKLLPFTLMAALAVACGNDTIGDDNDSIALGEMTASSSTAPSASPTSAPSPTPTEMSEPAAPMTPSLPDERESTDVAGVSTDEPAETDSVQAGDSEEPTPDCTDIPDPEQSCQQRLEWGNCEQQWMIDGNYCNRTCGRCQGGPSSAEGESSGETGQPSPSNDGTLGDDNPYPPIQGGQQGNSTRYWDCCKQSCGWTANASQPVSSCDFNDNNIGVNDQDRNVCDGGNATTCHGMAPWAHSTQVSYGYAAVNGAGCGSCWQLQFTGSSSTTPGDQGSAAIAGKTMVVMATNIGDLNGQLHFDLLIPGGGLGLNNGCTASLGIPAEELGANRGGFLTECAGAGDLEAKKQCVRDKCTSVFGNRGLTELEDGCLWFVDWFEAADNPDFLVQEIDCPQQLRGFN